MRTALLDYCSCAGGEQRCTTRTRRADANLVLVREHEVRLSEHRCDLVGGGERPAPPAPSGRVAVRPPPAAASRPIASPPSSSPPTADTSATAPPSRA